MPQAIVPAHHALPGALALTGALAILGGCSTGAPATPVPVLPAQTQGLDAAALAPFVAKAKASACADIRNRLWVIDERFVFWDRAGHCPDNSYEQILWDGSLEKLVGSVADSIAGPQRRIQDASQQALFDTLLANLDKGDLGLGPGHAVRAVPI